MTKQTNSSTDLAACPDQPDAQWAFDRYEQVRARLPALPAGHARKQCQYESTLLDVFEHFDAFVLDGFGVLNVGAQPVETAATRLRQMREAGKQIMVITNGATLPTEQTAQKYRGWGFELSDEQVISSRDALVDGLNSYPPDWRWGVGAADFSEIERLGVNAVLLTDEDSVWQGLDGFILLSSLQWTPALQTRLQAALAELPRPLLIGNPDIVAPHEGRFSLEPGHFGHLAADQTGVDLRLFGKPSPEVFAACHARLNATAGREVPGARIAMVGDSLHTDVLGAAAFGWRSVLVSSLGFFRNEQADPFIAASGITPDFCVHHT